MMRTQYEPGILINIYNLPKNFTGYVARESRPLHVTKINDAHLFCTAGPAIWQG